MLIADLKRAFRLPRWLGSLLLCALMLFFSVDKASEMIQWGFDRESRMFTDGAVDSLAYALMFERFKIVLMLLLMSLFTAVFCHDTKSRFIRMALTRCSLKKYVVSMFLANISVILATVLAAVFLYTFLFVSLGYRLVSADAVGLYYSELILERPVLFLVMAGLVLGMHAAACSSMGILFSAYRQNAFVSVGIGALVFYLALFLTPMNSVFSVLKMTAMDCCLPGGDDFPYAVMFCWSIAFPACICTLCGFFFYRRTKRRVDDGEL